MKITLLSEESVRLENAPGMLTVEAESAEQQFSPFHMLASGLAVCTFSLLHSWASHARIGADDLTIDVHWSFADAPHRVSDIHVALNWPSLPATRREAAKRAARLCPIHTTLHHPPTVAIETTT